MTDEILFERRGAAGVVTLNRPKALNALTRTMARAYLEKLDEWAQDDAVTRVVVTGAGDRAFCAGGDIRAAYDLGTSGREAEALEFFHDEYRLDAKIKHFRKPYIALIDGIVMGGGVGLSIHGSHRVAGDRFLFAMPEVGIGFFPDVGATWFLPRLPGKLGTFCALTGNRLGADDAMQMGIATHGISSRRFPELLDALTGNVSVEALLSAFAEAPGTSTPVFARRATIDRLFAGDSVEAILSALDREASGSGENAEWAAGVAEVIRARSPTSLKIALEQMQRGAQLDFDACMTLEYRIVSQIVLGHDFYEGVRAVIIDKDNKPRWRPATLAEVTPEQLDDYFAPLSDELALS